MYLLLSVSPVTGVTPEIYLSHGPPSCTYASCARVELIQSTKGAHGYHTLSFDLLAPLELPVLHGFHKNVCYFEGIGNVVAFLLNIL